MSQRMLSRFVGLTLLLASSVAVSAPLPRQIFVYGHAGRTGSLTQEGGTSRSLYVFWDASEGRLEEAIPAGSTLTLKRDGVVVRTFSLTEHAAAAEIATLYAGPGQARRLAETMALLDKAFEGSPGAPALTSGGAPTADLNPTPQTFASDLAGVLDSPSWAPIVALLSRQDANVAIARRRGWSEPITTATADWVTFSLTATSATGVTTTLGEVTVDTTSDYTPDAPMGLSSVTDRLFRCDSNDWSRAQGTVALTWDHPGVAPTTPAANVLLSPLPVVGYDVYAKAGVCPASLDVGAAAKATAFGPSGVVAMSGWRHVNTAPVVITSPAPALVPEGATGYTSTWRPAFTQVLELEPTLAAAGLPAGAAVCYAVVARDRTGNYGATATLATTVGDFMPPEMVWGVSAVTESVMAFSASTAGDGLTDTKSLFIEWPEVNAANWLWSWGADHPVCNAATVGTSGRLTVASSVASDCTDPKKTDAVRVDVVDYLIYRFDTAGEAEAYSDADGDGTADASERRVDTNGDRVADTAEDLFTSKELGQYPTSDVGTACMASSTSGSALTDVVPASAAVVGPDGRRIFRWSDATPVATRREGFWYRIGTRTADGRVSRLSPPIRASFPDMKKPLPFDVGPGGDAHFYACEPGVFQDDSPPDLETDSAQPDAGTYQPIIVKEPGAPKGDPGHQLIGVDLTGKAASIRITCLDEDLIARAKNPKYSATVEAEMAMRFESYVGSVNATTEVTEAIAYALPYAVPAGTRVGWNTPTEQANLCQALTRRMYSMTFDFNGDGGATGTLSQVCTPYVEFLDENGRPLAPPARMEVRDDGSYGFGESTCAQNPLAPGCENYGCNFIAVLDDTRCEQSIDDAGSVITGGFQVETDLKQGECAYVEVEQEFPTYDATGTITNIDIEPYRVGWQCCDSPSCSITQFVDPGNFGADMACYSLTRTHNTAKGAPNTLSSTRTPGPCVTRVPKDAEARTPAAPRILRLKLPADSTNGTLDWSAPEEAIGGVVVEYWREGAAAADRKTVFLSARGKYGALNAKEDPLPLGGTLSTGIERWCVTARSVGLAPPKLGAEGQLSAATSPLCVERRPADVALPENIPWPDLARPSKLGTLVIDYLWHDGIPFVSLGPVAPSAEVPSRFVDIDNSCPTVTDDCGCRPRLTCDPRNPEQACLARPQIEQGATPDDSVFYWTDADAEVSSRCNGFCRDINQQALFSRMVVYRRSRSHSSPTSLHPFIQASELLSTPACFFSRKQFRTWRPLVSQEGPVRFGMDDPNFAVLDMDRSASGGSARSMEVVWLDRHPHMDGRDYQYQFVYFDDRGEIRGYRETGWLNYRTANGHAYWAPEGEP